MKITLPALHDQLHKWLPHLLSENNRFFIIIKMKYLKMVKGSKEMLQSLFYFFLTNEIYSWDFFWASEFNAFVILLCTKQVSIVKATSLTIPMSHSLVNVCRLHYINNSERWQKSRTVTIQKATENNQTYMVSSEFLRKRGSSLLILFTEPPVFPELNMYFWLVSHVASKTGHIS